MSADISLVLRWLNGDSMTISTSPTSTPSTLLEHVRSRPCPHEFLIREGRVLDSWLSLVSQGVKPGDVLIVYKQKVAESPDARITSFESKTESILLEVLKINDAQYCPLEISRDGVQEYRRLQRELEAESWDDFMFLPNFPVIGKPKLSTDPLPMPIEDEFTDDDDESDDPAELRFTSIKQAAKFFSKHPWQRWAW
jgi:hypothetical protein